MRKSAKKIGKINSLGIKINKLIIRFAKNN
jgi:hypothetical protein